jgi:hypothetical protein
VTGQLDRWERRLERQLAAAPYVLLAASTVLALVADGGGERPWVTVVAVLLAVAWIRLVPAGGGPLGRRVAGWGPSMWPG